MSISSDDDDEDLSLDLKDEERMDEPNPMEEVKAIAKTETKRMRTLKFFVILSLLATGAAVTLAIHVFLRNKQTDEFVSRVRFDDKVLL